MKKIISITIFLLLICISYSQPIWQQFEGGTSDMSVYSLAIYQGDLVVAGFFDTIGNVPVHGIARWNGDAWTKLGNGLTGSFYGSGVRALTVFNGDLIAGGYFDSAGSILSKGIARWNGSSWSSMSGGVGGQSPHVEVLKVYNNELYVGGTFSTAGSIVATGIAKWTGFTWVPVGDPIYPPALSQNFAVYTLTDYNTQLCLGGTIMSTDNDSSVIAKWNGSTWTSIGGGIHGSIVKSSIVYRNSLVFGGSFYQAGNLPVNNIAVWDGSNWSSLGIGIDGAVYTFCFVNNLLYAGGTFYHAGGSPSSMISLWDGASWLPLGQGTNAGVLALINYPVYPVSTNIIAGGFFNQAGGITARHIATWGSFVGITPVNGQFPKGYLLAQNYPNPFNPSTVIKFEIPAQGNVLLTVYDSEGKEAATLINELMLPGSYQYNFNGSLLSSGTYFYKLQAGTYSETKKMILIK